MKIIETHLREQSNFSSWERDQIYNGLDTMITLEVFEAIKDQLDNETSRTYAFSRALQGPVLEMGLRGIRVDKLKRSKVIGDYLELIDQMSDDVEKLALDGLGMDKFNWRSNDDLKELFYNVLQIPAIKSKGHVSVDRNALEKLHAYEIARPFVNYLMSLRGLGKQLGVLQAPIDRDGRIRTSYNIGGTSTGRFSSSFSEFGTGGNLQNIEEGLRSIFIADSGMKFAKFDAKSGESYVVGAIEWNLFEDPTYLEACETGDPHTAVARICWPELGWSGDITKDKARAEQPYYRHYTYRFMCKKIGHGSNYKGQPYTLATQSHLPIRIVQQFQPIYFSAFPAHQRWQNWVEEEIRKTGKLISLMGRKRYFMGRRNDPKTIREAIAYDPQGSLADIVNTGMLNVWRARDVILMTQEHDAIVVQYPEEIEDLVVPKVLKQLEVKVELKHGRSLIIPYDCEVGWNKGKFHSEKNPEGLRAYKAQDERKRQPEKSILNRTFAEV